MKKFSAPPMIIILDVLFIMLFILIREQSPNIQIDLPRDTWLKDTVVISQNQKGEKQHWFNIKNNQWESFESFPSKKRNHDFIIGDIDCDKSTFCTQLSVVNDEIKKIYLLGDLADNISGMVTDSCLRFPNQCVNVVYYVQEDGTLDKKRIEKEHKIFSKIH